MRGFYLPLLLILLCSACNNQAKTVKQISETYEKRGAIFDNEVENCIVLPEIGCGGCIAGGEFFVKYNKEKFSPKQKKNLVVFTAINSKKLLLRNMEMNNFDEINCIVDTLDLYLPDGSNRIYPLILKLRNGRIIEATYQSPDSDKDYFSLIQL